MRYPELPESVHAYYINPVIREDEYRVRELFGCSIDLIIDVGAHVGTFSVLSRMLFPTARIIAFEPCSDSFALLQDNVLNLNIECHKIALGDGTYFAEPVRAAIPDNTGGTALLPGNQIASDTFRGMLAGCGITRLTNSTLVKVDCEGGEKQFLNSPEDTELLFSAGNICIEWHYDSSFPAHVDKDLIRPWFNRNFDISTTMATYGYDDDQKLCMFLIRRRGFPEFRRHS